MGLGSDKGQVHVPLKEQIAVRLRTDSRQHAQKATAVPHQPGAASGESPRGGLGLTSWPEPTSGPGKQGHTCEGPTTGSPSRRWSWVQAPSRSEFDTQIRVSLCIFAINQVNIQRVSSLQVPKSSSNEDHAAASPEGVHNLQAPRPRGRSRWRPRPSALRPGPGVAGLPSISPRQDCLPKPVLSCRT